MFITPGGRVGWQCDGCGEERGWRLWPTSGIFCKVFLIYGWSVFSYSTCLSVFQGFQLAHSLGGGTGSGLGTLLISKVAIMGFLNLCICGMHWFSINIMLIFLWSDNRGIFLSSDNRGIPRPDHRHLLGVSITQGWYKNVWTGWTPVWTLHDIAWWTPALENAWYCMILHDIAWYYMILHDEHLFWMFNAKKSRLLSHLRCLTQWWSLTMPPFLSIRYHQPQWL